MKKLTRIATAIIVTILACGCSWEDIAYGLAQLDGGTFVTSNDDDRGCDKWYDFADPGCF